MRTIERPIRITRVYREVYLVVKNNPGIKSKEVVKKSSIHGTSVFNILLNLQKVGLIRRELDTDHKYKCFATELDLEKVHKRQEELYKQFVAERDQANLQIEQPEDLLLKTINEFELSDKQWEFICNNKTMSRYQLAKKLKISKPVLVRAIEKRKMREGMKA